ncbi:MAG: PAS domain S-box protein [Acidimicrobiia bacterium]|nr:PAS domain S-box protein [Acidimicrobiia bacterium]
MADERDRGGEAACWAHLVDAASPLPDAVLAQLVRDAGDAVVVADPAGFITFWNLAAERVFGWPASEAVGQSLDLIIPERQRGRHWAGYEAVMATGETRCGEDLLQVPAVHADGGRRSIAFTVTLLRDEAGNPSGIAAIIRDETRRWNEERALRQRLAELGGPPS